MLDFILLMKDNLECKFKCSDIPIPESQEVECGAIPKSFWNSVKLELLDLPPMSEEESKRTGRDFITEVEGLHEFKDETYTLTLVPYYRRKDKIYCKVKGTDVKVVVCCG